MKKNYFLTTFLVSVFSFNLSANTINISNVSNYKTLVTNICQNNSNLELDGKINFVDSSPITNPTASSTSICEGDTLTLTANPSGGVAPYTFSWTGPNGYVSTNENPVLTNVNSSNAGTYSLVITDNIGATSTIQSTAIVIVNAKTDPTFDATLPAICKGGIKPLLSTTSTNGITGVWSPSIVNNITTTTYLFTPDTGQCANSLSFTIFVINNVTPTFTLPASICQGDTPPLLSTISNNGIVGTWSPAVVSNATSGSYTFSPSIGQCATSKTINITVNPSIAVFLPAIPPICSGNTLANLPTTSSNGVTGTWSPAINNTTTTTYTFTPSAGQCATATTSMTIVVNPNILPTFDAIPAICANGTAPVLPTSSNNGFTGTWNPALVSNTATGTYTFTPDAGQCATTASVSVTVNPNITPTFDAIPTICANATAPVLPSSSNNGFTGTWNPATVSNTATGTYTFTPDAGQCATTASVSVTVNPNILPTFDAIPAICANAAAPVLPSSSNNGFTGTWNPALVSNTATGTYTFTPDAGQCATTASVSVTVNPNILPTFDAIPAICANATAPVLPTSSNNGFTGTWNPATVSNTATGTYTFTPDAGQCATTTSANVTVIPNVIPTFNPIADVCYGTTAPSLPSTSINGITGTWNPTIVSNTTSGTYVFTPNAGPCATKATLTINVTTIIPTFNAIAPICANTTAPVLTSPSTNGITGSWNPAIVSNTSTGTYVFTPDAGQCATTAFLTITVNPIITPSFTAISQLCSGATSPILPLTSNNSISGTWNPTTISNTVSGTYTFTPTAGQCAIGTTLSVTVTPNTTPTFTAIAPICLDSTRPVLPTTSNNLITGTWNPAIVSNTASGTYTFTPTIGQCGLTTTLNITVNPSPTDIVLKPTDVVNDGPDGIIEIMSITSGIAPYQYSFNNSTFTTNTTYSNLAPGDYTITVKDSNGCEFSKVVTISSICLFPNVITPNGDTFNDTFNLKGCDVLKLELFNRYGRKVNSYTNYTDQWDGTSSAGEALPDGTYFYVAEIKGGTSKSGWVFITR